MRFADPAVLRDGVRKTLRSALAKARYRSCVCDAAVQHSDKKTCENRSGRLARAVRSNARPKNASRALLDALLTRSWRLLGRSWPLFGRPGPSPGLFGGHLARPGRPPEPPKSVPERSRNDPNRPKAPKIDFWTIFRRFGSIFHRFFIDFSSLFRRFCLAAGALAASLRRGCVRPTDPLNMFLCGRSARLAMTSTTPCSTSLRCELYKCTYSL